MVPVDICSHVLQRGHEVERHQFGCVDGHHPIDVPGAQRLDVTLYCPFDGGFIVVLVFFDGHRFLLTLTVQDSYTRRNTLCVCDTLSRARSASRLRHHSTSPGRREQRKSVNFVITRFSSWFGEE